MKPNVLEFYKQVDSILNIASDNLTEHEYMELCSEVESNADARYNAMEEQIKNISEEDIEDD